MDEYLLAAIKGHVYATQYPSTSLPKDFARAIMVAKLMGYDTSDAEAAMRTMCESIMLTQTETAKLVCEIEKKGYLALKAQQAESEKDKLM